MDHYRGDVTYELWISVAEAAAGTERTFAFHTPQGQPRLVAICVPAGARDGDLVVVPGEGGPSQSSAHYGDFYAAIRLGVPQAGQAGHPTSELALAAAAGRAWPPHESSDGPLRQWLRQLRRKSSE